MVRSPSGRNPLNDFPPPNASRCEPVNVGVYGGFEATLHDFYTVLSGTCRRTAWCLSVRLGMISERLHDHQLHQRSGSVRKNALAASSAALR